MHACVSGPLERALPHPNPVRVSWSILIKQYDSSACVRFWSTGESSSTSKPCARTCTRTCIHPSLPAQHPLLQSQALASSASSCKLCILLHTVHPLALQQGNQARAHMLAMRASLDTLSELVTGRHILPPSALFLSTHCTVTLTSNTRTCNQCVPLAPKPPTRSLA